MSTDNCIPSNVQEIAAPLLLGAVWNWALYGVLVTQVYVYSYNFTEDRKSLKVLVYAVFFLETLQTALSGADLYYWFVSGFGNVKHLSNPYTSPYNTPIIGAVISMVVQFFFSYRIWVLSGRKPTRRSLCAVICLFSIVSAGGAFTGAIQTIIRSRFPTGRTLRVEAMTWITGNALCDLLIAVSMVHLLARHAAFENLLGKHAMVKIIRLVVETNVLTTFVGITAFIVVAVFPDKNWFICP
ncbi:hypothetical protein BC834DRAFT_971464 [Gloeopeniophorella convolvens]|nr:hypothetical protein BC834DRAFT_971464 [Gloeopeniophorella convolvens]